MQRYDNSLLLKKNGIAVNLTIIDIILLVLFVPALWSGISKGLVRQVAGILALILGIWGAWHFSDAVAQLLKSYFEADRSVLKVSAFIIIFTGILVIVWLVGRAAEGIIKITLLSWVDKLLGVVFAILKTAFILSIIIYFLNYLDSVFEFLPKKEIADSDIYQFISRIAPSLFPYIKSL